uniref:Lon N-terminal domain-containing protein n=1 Tax=Pyramimonas obovata TaxID=1411642 RepID=A0A7S0RJ41_9CHLO
MNVVHARQAANHPNRNLHARSTPRTPRAVPLPTRQPRRQVWGVPDARSWHYVKVGKKISSQHRGGNFRVHAGLNSPLSEDVDCKQLPCLIFSPQEVFLPGSRKVLHLYEARFLSLLDESMKKTGGLLGHIICYPANEYDDSGEGGLAIERVATLCRIEKIERQDIGARVDLVGEARMEVNGIVSTDPYITGTFRQVPTFADPTLYKPTEIEMSNVEGVVRDIRQILDDIIQLSDRLKGPAQGEAEKVAGWQEWGHAEISDLKRSLSWVDGSVVRLEDLASETTMEEIEWADQETLGTSPLEVAERLSFAVLQLAPASSTSELRHLIGVRRDAMGLECGLLVRLQLGRDLLEEQVRTLRAKVALKSLEGL